ncbi:hypothetical protein SESBI_45974 [Sesbania bispinosa]|nr:hypothetical protein SESBI_45974 [Sesbania bispinosa]
MIAWFVIMKRIKGFCFPSNRASSMASTGFPTTRMSLKDIDQIHNHLKDIHVMHVANQANHGEPWLVRLRRVRVATGWVSWPLNINSEPIFLLWFQFLNSFLSNLSHEEEEGGSLGVCEVTKRKLKWGKRGTEFRYQFEMGEMVCGWILWEGRRGGGKNLWR